MDGAVHDRRTPADDGLGPRGGRQRIANRGTPCAPVVHPRRLARGMVLAEFPGFLRRHGLPCAGGQSPRPRGQRDVETTAALFARRYIEDVESVAATLPARPVVIGHSLGGFIAQKYLESNDAPAGVLMASAPPQGSRGFTLRLMRRYPWLVTRGMFTGDARHGFNTP